jgi:hypothetical protein
MPTEGSEPKARITREQFRETVRQARGQGVTAIEVLAEVASAFAAPLSYDEDGDPSGQFQPGGGNFGGGGASGKW